MDLRLIIEGIAISENLVKNPIASSRRMYKLPHIMVPCKGGGVESVEIAKQYNASTGMGSHQLI